MGGAVCWKSCLWKGLSEGAAGGGWGQEGLCVGRTFVGPCLNSVCL